MSLLQSIRNDIEGAKVLADWLGDGDPVHPMVAELRAKRCVQGANGEKCPHNVARRWWEVAKEKAADWIKAELELKNHMDLKVPQEDELHMCSICGCCTRLKVWTPIVHIKAHISDEQLNQTPPHCWMRAEILGYPA